MSVVQLEGVTLPHKRRQRGCDKAIKLDGLAVEVPRTPIEREAFLQQLRGDWCGQDPRRWRSLAALVLRVNGFSYPEIGLALNCEKQSAQALSERARRNIGHHFEAPAPVDAPPPAEACVDGDGWTE